MSRRKRRRNRRNEEQEYDGEQIDESDACEAPDCNEPPFGDWNVCVGHLVEAKGPAFVKEQAAGFGLHPVAAEVLSGFAAIFSPAAGEEINRRFAGLRGGPGGARPRTVVEPPEPTPLEFLHGLGFRPTKTPVPPAEVEIFRKRMARAFHADQGDAPVAGDMMSKINAACDAVKEAQWKS